MSYQPTRSAPAEPLTHWDMATVAFVVNNREHHVYLGPRLELVRLLAIAGF